MAGTFKVLLDLDHVKSELRRQGLDIVPCNDWTDRRDALEALWSAWKKVIASGTGYDPAFTEAVKRLEQLEREG